MRPTFLSFSPIPARLAFSTGQRLTLSRDGWTLLKTSAKTGENVETAFHALGQSIVSSRAGSKP